MPCVVISIPKHSFFNTVCVCMVTQIKLVVVVVLYRVVAVFFGVLSLLSFRKQNRSCMVQILMLEKRPFFYQVRIQWNLHHGDGYEDFVAWIYISYPRIP